MLSQKISFVHNWKQIRISSFRLFRYFGRLNSARNKRWATKLKQTVVYIGCNFCNTVPFSTPWYERYHFCAIFKCVAGILSNVIAWKSILRREYHLKLMACSSCIATLIVIVPRKLRQISAKLAIKSSTDTYLLICSHENTQLQIVPSFMPKWNGISAVCWVGEIENSGYIYQTLYIYEIGHNGAKFSTRCRRSLRHTEKREKEKKKHRITFDLFAAERDCGMKKLVMADGVCIKCRQIWRKSPARIKFGTYTFGMVANEMEVKGKNYHPSATDFP